MQLRLRLLCVTRSTLQVLCECPMGFLPGTSPVCNTNTCALKILDESKYTTGISVQRAFKLTARQCLALHLVLCKHKNKNKNKSIT